MLYADCAGSEGLRLCIQPNCGPEWSFAALASSCAGTASSSVLWVRALEPYDYSMPHTAGSAAKIKCACGYIQDILSLAEECRHRCSTLDDFIVKKATTAPGVGAELASACSSVPLNGLSGGQHLLDTRYTHTPPVPSSRCGIAMTPMLHCEPTLNSTDTHPYTPRLPPSCCPLDHHPLQCGELGDSSAVWQVCKRPPFCHLPHKSFLTQMTLQQPSSSACRPAYQML